MRIEGRAKLDYPAYRRLVWASGKMRLLGLWAILMLGAVGGLLLSSTAVVPMIVMLVLAPLLVDLSLRRVWRRLAAGGPNVTIEYDLTDERMRVSIGGVSTEHRWDSVRPVHRTERHWVFRSLLSRQPIAVPRDAFGSGERAEIDAVFAGLRSRPLPA